MPSKSNFHTIKNTFFVLGLIQFPSWNPSIINYIIKVANL
jgi:hypothetical protein